MSTRESAALKRRLTELGDVEIVRRTDEAVIVRVDGACILLDGRRLAADPKHKGLRLSGADLELRAHHAEGAIDSKVLELVRLGLKVHDIAALLNVHPHAVKKAAESNA